MFWFCSDGTKASHASRRRPGSRQGACPCGGDRATHAEKRAGEQYCGEGRNQLQYDSFEHLMSSHYRVARACDRQKSRGW